MNGLYFGSNIDGGTYPAQIWGDYMKKVVSKGCGKWLTPKEPFNSQAFQGRYAREGAEDDETGEGETGTTTPGADQAQPPADDEPADPKPRDAQQRGRQRRRLRSRGLRVATAGRPGQRRYASASRRWLTAAR